MFHSFNRASNTHEFVEYFFKIIPRLFPHNSIFEYVVPKLLVLSKLQYTVQSFHFETMLQVEFQVSLVTDIIFATFIKKRLY